MSQQDGAKADESEQVCSQIAIGEQQANRENQKEMRAE